MFGKSKCEKELEKVKVEVLDLKNEFEKLKKVVFDEGTEDGLVIDNPGELLRYPLPKDIQSLLDRMDKAYRKFYNLALAARYVAKWIGVDNELYQKLEEERDKADDELEKPLLEFLLAIKDAGCEFSVGYFELIFDFKYHIGFEWYELNDTIRFYVEEFHRFRKFWGDVYEGYSFKDGLKVLYWVAKIGKIKVGDEEIVLR